MEWETSKIKAKEIYTFYFHSEVLGTTRAMFLTLSSEVIIVFVSMRNPSKLSTLGPVWVVNDSNPIILPRKPGERIAALCAFIAWIKI